MVKKPKFQLLNYLIGLFLIGSIYFTIGALKTESLNLNPLFALGCFIIAFGIFSLRLLVNFFLKDPQKINIANTTLIIITSVILVFLGIIWLEINGFFI